MNRRLFLKASGIALAGSALTPKIFAKMAAAATTRGKKTLVAIFQRGAVDGLNMIVPYGESAYYSARPSIAIPRSDVLDLDGFFGAHPSLQSLMPFWKDRSLAIVHAAGSPDNTRSHFDAQDFMESGTPGVKSTETGFLARAMATKTLRALRGTNDVEYPRTPLATSLKQIAQLIKSDVGLEVAFADVSGWDTHAGEGGAQGQLANNLRNFSEAIAAFAKDLSSRMSDVVLVTMSEFGRTVRENGNRGTDHGHATAMLLLGGNVRGGKVHGRWPGLKDLYEGRDLVMTTDFRDVFGEVLTKHLAVPSLASVFPRYETRPLGVL